MAGHQDILTILAIAVALSMDSVAFSVTHGSVLHRIRFKNAFTIAFSFGFFQALMPVIGWAAGLTIKSYIEALDHWIAFGLLFIIGSRMIFHGVRKKGDADRKERIDLSTILILSIATSIDALAVGLSFAMLDIQILLPVIAIGVITFINSFIGIHLGHKAGRFLGKKLEAAGGIILILIGVKIVIEHITLGI